MYSLCRRHWSTQQLLIDDAESSSEASDQIQDWQFVDLVHNSPMSVKHLHPTEAWAPKDTPTCPRLRRLQCRATVAPGSNQTDEPQGQTQKTEAIRMQRISSAEKTPSFHNHRVASQEELSTHTEAFLQYIEEAAVTLDRASRDRNKSPWWERLLLYLKAVWKDEPQPCRSPSRLLYWHVHALGHEQISSTPIANGEYVVAFDSAILLQQPRQHMSSFYKVLRSLTHATNWSHERLHSPQESRKVIMGVA